MIANMTATNSIRKTLDYVLRKSCWQVYGNFAAALLEDIETIASAMEYVIEKHQSYAMKRPGYHISLSPSQEDSLSRRDWIELSKRFIELIGVENQFQAIAALHDDVTYPDSSQTRFHVHFVINRVSPSGTFNLSTQQVERAVRTIEREFGLEPLLNSWEVLYQKRKEKSMDIGDLNRKTSQHPLEPLPAVKTNNLSKAGFTLQTIGNQVGSRGEYVDGHTIIGSALSLAGSAALIVNALSKAKENSSDDRLNKMIDQLGELHDRSVVVEEELSNRHRANEVIENIETLNGRVERVSNVIPIVQPESTSEPAAESGQLLKGRSVSSLAEDPLAVAVEQIDQNIGNLGTSIGLEKHEPIKIDKNASMSEKLDQIEKAIQHLSERMTQIEQIVFPEQVQAQTADREEATTKEVSPPIKKTKLSEVEKDVSTGELGDRLLRFIESRSEVTGRHPNQSFTSTIGQIRMGMDGSGNKSVVVEDEKAGVVFSAIKQEANPSLGIKEKWIAQHNQLREEEKDVILKMPQTPEEYRQKLGAVALVESMYRNSEGRLESYHDRHWKQDGEFDYQISVDRSEDGTASVRFSEKGKDVLNARVNEEGRVWIDKTEIPSQRIQQHFEKQQQQPRQREQIQR